MAKSRTVHTPTDDSSEEVKPTRRAKRSEEIILKEGENLVDVVQEVTEPEDLKNVVCPFYKKGRATKCFGCKQEEETIEECKDALIDGLLKRPQFGLVGAYYTPEFDLPLVLAREKKASVVDTVSMGLLCNTCHVSDNCPLYQANYECGIDWKEGVDTDNPKEVMNHLIGLQMERVTRARKMELIDGGMPDQTTSTEMDRLTSMIGIKDNLDADRFSMRIDATAKSGSAGGGILAKLFAGGGGSTTEALPEADTTLEIKTIDFEELETIPATRDKRKSDENKA